jgi:hybrid cluster-associated redox disulfide protein
MQPARAGEESEAKNSFVPASGPLAGESIELSAHFNKDMTVENAFKTHAGARRVFAKFHLGGCSNCAISETETIEQVSEGYGIPLPMLMDELEALYASGGLNVGDKVRLPDEIRSKIPQLANVPDIGEVKSVESGAYTVEFGDVRLQGLADDFIKVETAGATA